LILAVAKGGVWNELVKKSVEKILGNPDTQELFKIQKLSIFFEE
jgi:hypothetical protein